MPTVEFRRSAQVTLDAIGAGTVRLAPSARDWTIRGMSVNVSTAVAEAKCVVCADHVGDFYIVASTRTGSSGDTSDTIHNVPDGHCLYVVWQDGDPGAIASVTYYGDETS